MNKRLLLVIGALFIVAGAIAAACSADTDDLEARIEALEQQIGSDNGEEPGGQAEIEHASMVATLTLIDGIGFHDLNEQIVADELAPAGTVGAIRNATTAVATTLWPADLEEGAAAFQADLEAFLALLAEDAQGTEIVDASTVAHDSYHDFTDTAWGYLEEHAGIASSGGGDHESDEMGHEETSGATEEMNQEEEE